MKHAPCPRETSHPVETGHTAHVEDAVSALADAFDGYAWTSWTVPAHDHAQRLRGLFRVTISEVGLPFGEVWVSRCPATRDVVGAAVALRPDREVPDEVWHRVAPVEEALMGDRLPAAQAAEAACRPLRPSEPHLVLATIGVRRDHQRRGVASALLHEVVSLADSLGVPTYLETSSAANLALYARAGFSVLDAVSVPNGGPPVWGMTRHRFV